MLIPQSLSHTHENRGDFFTERRFFTVVVAVEQIETAICLVFCHASCPKSDRVEIFAQPACLSQ